MCSPEEIINYHCPRWNELPDIGLYIDQVISILEKNLNIFSPGNDQKLITPTMINNYVKQKMIPAPVNKRYDRRHVANLTVICMFKRFISLSDIRAIRERMLESFGMEDCYDLFCSEFERSLLSVFGVSGAYDISDVSGTVIPEDSDLPARILKHAEKNSQNPDGDSNLEIAVSTVKTLTFVCASLIYSDYLIKTIIGSDEKESGKK